MYVAAFTRYFYFKEKALSPSRWIINIIHNKYSKRKPVQAITAICYAKAMRSWKLFVFNEAYRLYIDGVSGEWGGNGRLVAREWDFQYGVVNRMDVTSQCFYNFMAPHKSSAAYTVNIRVIDPWDGFISNTIFDIINLYNNPN